MMITGIRQRAIVGEGGKVEIVSPDLPSGTVVDVIVIVDPDEVDTTEYLLSSPANRLHLLESIQDLEYPEKRIYVDLHDL